MAALAHPLWWIALVLLVFNDHFLKASGLLPEPITGKLSDLAGLVVFPVLVAAALGARSRGARVAVVAAIGAAFAAMKLSPAVRGVVEDATALIGVPWSVELDATDLAALVVLPLAYTLSAAEPLRRRHVERAGLVIGAAACLASGRGADGWGTSAFLLNRTGETVSVRLRWPRAHLDCGLLAGRHTRALGPAVFGAGRTFRLQNHETLALDEDAYHLAGERPRELIGARCGAAVIELDGRPDTLAFWTEGEGQFVQLLFEEGEVPDGLDTSTMVELVHRDGELALENGPRVERAPLLERIEPDACASESRAGERFQWSALPGPVWSIVLRDLVVQHDGCVDLVPEEGPRFTMCVPARELPFAPGDLLSFFAADSEGGRGLRVTRSSTTSGDVELRLWSGGLPIPDLPADVVELPCSAGTGGHRLACGSFVVPSALELELGPRLVAGTAIELPAKDGRRTRIAVGRAERFAVGVAACGAGADLATASTDVLMITEEDR